MKKYFVMISFAFAMMMMLSPAAFAEDEYVSKDFKVNDFTAFVCSIPCAIEYTEGDAAVNVYADKKVVEHLKIDIKKGKLTIAFDKMLFYNLANMKIKISCPTLENIELNGAITFVVKGGIEAETFEANLNGTSKLTLDKIEAQSVAINNNGTASLEIKGIECDRIAVNVNGVGGCELAGHAKTAKLVVNGIGGININSFTADNLNSEVNGIGKISRDK